ncbi:Beta-lactamase-like protein [Naviculisporaceae sp. PSN 640]
MAIEELTPLAEVERLSPRVIRILGGNPNKFTLQGTNTYLVGTGPNRILIDTAQGLPSWKAALQRTLAEENATVSSAIITHWHGDHVGGIPDLLDFSPSSKIYKNQNQDPRSSLKKGEQLDIADNQIFSVPGATLRAVHTPGHTIDHMVLLLQEEDSMFTGDNVLGHGTAVFEDLGAYLASLTKMATLFNGKAYPGHGAVLLDGPAKIAEYISHRQRREDQVVQCLKGENANARVGTANAEDSSKSWTVMDLVKIIYQDVPEALHLPASSGVVQILKKLRREGKVIDIDGDRWRLVLPVVTTRSAL